MVGADDRRTYATVVFKQTMGTVLADVVESPKVAVLASDNDYALVTNVTHKITAGRFKSGDMANILPCSIKDLFLFLLIDLCIEVILPRKRIRRQGVVSESPWVRQVIHIRKPYSAEVL